MKQRMKKVVVLACLSGNVLVLGGCAKQVEVKRKGLDIAVHSSLPMEADIYFKHAAAKEEVKVVKSNLDVQTLGTYRVWMEYGQKKACMRIRVVDTEAPKLRVMKTSFTFPLDTSLTAVNQTIRKQVVITDNYDTSFADWKPIRKLPDKAQTMKLTLQVEDQSHNLSNKVNIQVRFTKKTAEKKLPIVQKKQRIQAISKPVGDRQDNSTEKQEKKTAPKDVKKQEKLAKEEAITTLPKAEKPRLSVANFPTYLLGNSGRVFASYEEAESWAKQQTKIEGGPWFGYYMEIGQPFDGDYANAGEKDTPWTVDFFR